MNTRLIFALLGALAAIAVTTAMDATGLTMFSALPLFPLAAFFWWLQRFQRREVGLARGGPGRLYAIAALYPVAVMAAASLIALVAGQIDISKTEWGTAAINLFVGGVMTVLVAIITEEGFFRGWLWASLRRAGMDSRGALIWSSVAFALWHVSAVSFGGDYGLPPARIPIFLANALLLGLAWGILREISGSVVVAAVAHGVWNGFAYTLFAFGERVGALGVERTWIHGPEVGIVGLVLNLVVLILLWRLRQRSLVA